MVTICLDVDEIYRKTQDILDFVYEYQGTLVSVFWIHAASKLHFEQDYRRLSQVVGIPGNDDPKKDIRPIVKVWLESPSSGNWIMVLDNADNKLDFFPDKQQTNANESGANESLANFIPHGTKGIVIVTTRDYEVADRLAGGMNTLDKKAMDPVGATQLFHQRYSRTDGVGDSESIAILLRALQYLPLAIVQVGDFLRLNKLISPSDYLTKFISTRESQKYLLSKPLSDHRRDPDSNSETILTTFAITFRQIQEQSPLASSLLNIIACVDHQGIPYEFLARCGVNSTMDEFILKEAISKLINFSLLTAIESSRTYEMHSLVHLSIEVLQSPHEMDAAVESAAKALAEILPDGESENLTTWRIYLPHTSTLIRKVRTESIHTATIHCLLSWYLLRMSNYSEAQWSAQISVKVRTDLLGQVHPDTLTSIHFLAFTYNRQGRWDVAEELYVQVVEMRKQVLGPEHPDTLLSMDNLAMTYHYQMRWREAEELQMQVMETKKRVLGQEHPGTLGSMGNLALTYWGQRRWKKAKELEVQVMETSKRVLGQDHPDTLLSMHNVSSTYRSQGRWKEAEELDVQVIEMSKRVLGQEHPDTLLSMDNLSSTYQSQRRWREAEELHVQVIETSKRVLGQEHPDTLRSMANLSLTYWNQRRWKDAEELLVQIVEMSKRVHDQQHPDTLISMSNLALIYWNQERLKEAEKLQVQVMEMTKRVLGQEHRDTLLSMGTLASTYRSQGRWKKAEELGMQVLAVRKRILGPENPDTLTNLDKILLTSF